MATQKAFAAQPVLSLLENTDFLQAVTLLATHRRNLASTGPKPPAVSARREDILKLELDDYLEWVEPLRKAFLWAADFLADRHIFTHKFLPYPKQLVPLAVIKVIMGGDADLHGPKGRLVEWFWCGILGELYVEPPIRASSATSSRFRPGRVINLGSPCPAPCRRQASWSRAFTRYAHVTRLRTKGSTRCCSIGERGTG